MTWELSDLLRAIATTIVIGIHASHHWWFGVHDTTTINFEIFIDTIINQVGRFTVPIFVILSGFAFPCVCPFLCVYSFLCVCVYLFLCDDASWM